MKIISYSLYGDVPMYCVGAIRNAEDRHKFYPEWICRFYYDNTVPTDTITKLTELGCELIDMTESKIPGMYWRFLPMGDENVDFFIVRDVDSRLSDREKFAVNEWIDSGKTLHIMRDHPHHNFFILGGMWGFKNNKYNFYGKLINFLENRNYNFIKGDDQIFLIDLYNNFISDNLSHDSFFNHYHNTKHFPTERTGKRFIGEIFDENDIPHYQYTLIP